MTIRSVDAVACCALASTRGLLWEELRHQEFVDAVEHPLGDVGKGHREENDDRIRQPKWQMKPLKNCCEEVTVADKWHM